MNITKKEFTDLITSNKSLFMGVSNEFYDYYYVGNVTSEYLTDNALLEHRKAKKKGKYIVFSDDSYLNLNDNEYNKYTTYKYDYCDCIVLIAYCKYFSVCDKEWLDKIMYYIIKK